MQPWFVYRFRDVCYGYTLSEPKFGSKGGKRLQLPARSGTCQPYWLEALAFQPLAFEFPCAPDCFGGLARAAFRRFFIVPPNFHFSENSFPLQLFLERFERLINIIIANQNLHLADHSFVVLRHASGPEIWAVFCLSSRAAAIAWLVQTAKDFQPY
jgi:hypothetical protein